METTESLAKLFVRNVLSSSDILRHDFQNSPKLIWKFPQRELKFVDKGTKLLEISTKKSQVIAAVQ